MINTKANAKENLGEFVCLAITKAKARKNLQTLISNRFRADYSSIHKVFRTKARKQFP